MLVDVVAVVPLEGFVLRLRFKDGVEGDFDVASNVDFQGVFAPLQDPEYFKRVVVNSEIGTVVWPNGADLDPQVLYQAALCGRRGPLVPASANV
jgi:hypothetical protein